MRPDPSQNPPDPGFVPGVQPDTLPMSRSPYGNWRVGAPPPPPTGGLRRQPPPYQPPPSSRRGLVLGIISAVFLCGLVVGGLYLADPALFATAQMASVTVTVTATPLPATATLAPTVTLPPSPTLTPSPAPTATDTPAPTATATLPATPTGFQSYGGNSDWTISYPSAITYATGSVTVQGVVVPDVRFDLGHSAQLTVYDSPQAATSDMAQQILATALATSGASNVKTIAAPAPATIGAVTWQRAKVSATLHGVLTIVVALYVTHDTGALAIAYSAPATTFATIEAQTCLPMVQTFMFAQ